MGRHRLAEALSVVLNLYTGGSVMCFTQFYALHYLPEFSVSLFSLTKLSEAISKQLLETDQNSGWQ